MNTVPAISRDNFDRSKNPLFRVSIGKLTQMEDSTNTELLLDDRHGSMRSLAIELWEQSSTGGRLPSVRDMLEEKWAHFSNHSIIIDIEGEASVGSLPAIKLDQIGEGLKYLLRESAKVEELSDIFLPPLSDALETKQPVSFEFSWNTEERGLREFQSAVLPFGYTKIRSMMIVIEESAKSGEVEGEYVLNLDESHILSGEDEKSGQSSSATEKEADLDQEMPAREMNDRSLRSVVNLISDARDSAKSAHEAEEKSRMALYAALSRSYDLALCAAETPEVFAAQLIFGGDCSEGKLAGYIAVLAEALNRQIPQGELSRFLQDLDGGIEALIETNRRRK